MSSLVKSQPLRPLITCSSLYCSSATKELLLRLERYPHKVNFAKGILESRKQSYKNLQNLLVRRSNASTRPRLIPSQKPIPMETPTKIELAPRNEIQVTLFNANHCTGAVMFRELGVDTA